MIGSLLQTNNVLFDNNERSRCYLDSDSERVGADGIAQVRGPVVHVLASRYTTTNSALQSLYDVPVGAEESDQQTQLVCLAGSQ
jgi:hypothetical protein